MPNGDAAIDECEECYAGGINNPEWNSTCVVTSSLIALDADSGGWISAWPNPATDRLSVGVYLTTGETVYIQLIDASGRMVAVANLMYVSPKVLQRIDIDVSSLGNGLFICRATTESMVLTNKILINR